MRMKIWEKRDEKGISVAALSKLSGISQGALSNYENNKRFPNMKSMEKIAKALDSRIEELYESDYKYK